MKNMKTMENKSDFDLITRINEITKEQQQLELKIIKLDMEFNEIVQELWDRIPSLKDDVNLQKKKVRKYEDNRFIK